MKTVLIGIALLATVAVAIAYSIKHAHRLDDDDEEGIR